MTTLDFQTMPAPFGGLSSNLFIHQAAPVVAITPKASGPTIGQVIKECLAAKLQGNRRPVYVTNLKVYLNMFARGRESTPIADFDLRSLESWFASRKEAPATRRGAWGRLSTMFTYARKRGYIAANPCASMDMVKVDAEPPRIFSPAEAETLLCFLNTHGRRRKRIPQVVLGMFCGIRPTELTRIHWRDIDLERAVVRVDASASKVRQRRIVPIPENALAWLKSCKQDEKQIGAMRWKWISDVERNSGIQWSKDVLRHTAASYLLAKHEDCGKVSRWLGNSPTILLRHYTELVSAEDCAAFWAIVPHTAAAKAA